MACRKPNGVATPVVNEPETPVITDPGDSTDTGNPGPVDTVVVEPPPPAPKYYSQTPVHTSLSPNIGGFYESLPQSYDSFPAKKFPLLIFLHGGGERGDGNTQLDWITTQGLPKLITQNRFPPSFAVDGEQFSFVIIYPQFKVDSWPTNTDVGNTLEYALQHYRIDESRIYLVGMSMGGGAAWEYTQNFSRKVTAIVPICGASWPQPADTKKIATTNIPVWAFHNADDSGVKYSSTTQKYYDGIRNENPSYPIRLTLWETGGHDAWTLATDPQYREEGLNIYEWLLKHKKN